MIYWTIYAVGVIIMTLWSSVYDAKNPSMFTAMRNDWFVGLTAFICGIVWPILLIFGIFNLIFCTIARLGKKLANGK